ncbi:MAG: pirin family protein [Pseudomonadota bacterium]|nr:pirin family protein [Pseudomonadota bacterium]
MSVESRNTPETENGAAFDVCPDVEIIIEKRKRDLGGFSVGRVLPFAKRRMVGPFIFLDEMGPATFSPGSGIDVRPHPHIGLATVTYLFEGEIRHKDNLGVDQLIRPGDVNWMTSGRGIVHSERTDAALRAKGHTLHGIQSWVALPVSHEDTAPSFQHHPRLTLPMIERPGLQMRLIAGRAYGAESPVKTFSEMFYLGVEAQKDARIALPSDHEERALYLVSGSLSVNGIALAPGRLLVFAKGADPKIVVSEPSRLMLLGGANIGPRLIWWNLVASSSDRIEAGKKGWRDAAATGFAPGVFTLPPGETEHIPLPPE